MCALLGLPHPGWRMIKSTVSKHKETKSSKAAPCVLNKLKQVILHILCNEFTRKGLSSHKHGLVWKIIHRLLKPSLNPTRLDPENINHYVWDTLLLHTPGPAYPLAWHSHVAPLVLLIIIKTVTLDILNTSGNMTFATDSMYIYVKGILTMDQTHFQLPYLFGYKPISAISRDPKLLTQKINLINTNCKCIILGYKPRAIFGLEVNRRPWNFRENTKCQCP